jgi:kinesin family protein C2/C3
MAMVNQHKQELEVVRAGGREKMAAMQTELVTTMEMLEKMYNGWQNSLEDALTEMRIASEAERKKAVEAARQEVEGHLLDSERRLTHLQEQYQIEHARRKISHNKLIEMMGNIRVICRVRPINKTELATGQGQDCTAYPTEAADENIIIKTPVGGAGKSMTIDPNDPGTKFEFDTVFGPTSTQQQVFNELKPLVTSCMDGFSVTIFAYGQTGSGKTYTMEGGDQPDGLCYRAFSELFDIRDQRCESGRMAYSIKVSMLEIYNEQVSVWTRLLVATGLPSHVLLP